MSKSLQSHSLAENYKQINLRMKNRGLDTVAVQITNRAGKFRYAFTGSAEQVVKAEAIFAAWG